MEQLKYSRINWTIEIIIILVIFLQLIILDQNNSRQDAFVAFIIYWIIYFNLSIVMYYSLSPSVLFKNSDNPKADENKFELTPSEVLAYIKKGILFTSLCKLCLLLIPAFLSILFNIYGKRIAFLAPGIFLFLFFFASMMIFRSLQYFIKARGYKDITFRKTLKDGLLYFNPTVKRINFASKDGRLVLYVLLAIPITFISMLLIALKLAGKL